MSKVTEEAYDEWLDELGESALTGYSAAWLFKRADSIAYQLGLNEYTDELEEECRPTPPDFEPCFTEREMEDIYDEMLEDSLGLDWLADRYSISWLIKRADPTAYRVGFNDYEDMMTEDNGAETFAAHETNCDCYQCEKKKWDARSYWEKQILLDDPEQYHRKSRDLGWNETRKCRRCAKWGGEVYGAKVTEYNDGLRLYHYEDCGCGVYDHSIRNRRRKKWRRERSRIRQEEMNALIRKREQENRQREARKKAQKKWWQFWRAESYDTEYNFVMSDIGEADERVEEKLDEGWKLYGDPVVFEKQDFTVFGQGMTKDAETFQADPLLQAIKDREKARKAGTVKLQGMPRTKGTKAEDVKVGDVLVWNQGGTSQVMSITPKGKQSLLWKTRTEDGREWERTVRKNRLVVVARPNGWIAKKYADMKSESFAADSKEEARLKKYEKTYGKEGAKVRNRIFKRILAKAQDGTKAGQWSARKAQSLTEDYEKAMGKKGKKPYKSSKRTKSQKSLKNWGDQDWRTKSGKKSSKTGERYLPAKAIKALTDEEYKKTSAKKRKDMKKGKQFSDQPKSIAKKVKKYRAESSKPSSVEISRSSNPEKKLMAVFEDKEGKKVKTTHFGQRGASDYTKHGDKERMKRYLERHGGGTTTSTKENWKDPTTAGSLSRWVLWNKPSLSGSFSDYKRRFGLKGNLKVGKSAESQVEMSKPMSFYVGVVAGLGGFLALRSYFQNEE